MAECSESIGRIGAYVFGASGITQAPPTTSDSLLASASFFPRLERRHRGRQPGIAYQGVDHHFGISASRDLSHGLLSGVNLHVGVRKCFALRAA